MGLEPKQYVLEQPRSQTGGTAVFSLFVSYINFAPNSRVLTAGWDGGMKFYDDPSRVLFSRIFVSSLT